MVNESEPVWEALGKWLRERRPLLCRLLVGRREPNSLVGQHLNTISDAIAPVPSPGLIVREILRETRRRMEDSRRYVNAATRIFCSGTLTVSVGFGCIGCTMIGQFGLFLDKEPGNQRGISLGFLRTKKKVVVLPLGLRLLSFRGIGVYYVNGCFKECLY